MVSGFCRPQVVWECYLALKWCGNVTVPTGNITCVFVGHMETLPPAVLAYNCAGPLAHTCQLAKSLFSWPLRATYLQHGRTASHRHAVNMAAATVLG